MELNNIEDSINIINKFFGLSIEPRGNLDQYHLIIDEFFPNNNLFFTREQLIEKCKQVRRMELENDLINIENSLKQK